MVLRFAAGLLMLIIFALGGSPTSIQSESFAKQVELEYEVKYMESLNFRTIRILHYFMSKLFTSFG